MTTQKPRRGEAWWPGVQDSVHYEKGQSEIQPLVTAMRRLQPAWRFGDKNWKGHSVYEDARTNLIIEKLEKPGRVLVFYPTSTEEPFVGFYLKSEMIISWFCFVLFLGSPLGVCMKKGLEDKEVRAMQAVRRIMNGLWWRCWPWGHPNKDGKSRGTQKFSGDAIVWTLSLFWCTVKEWFKMHPTQVFF